VYKTLKVEREGALAWLTLDRPQRLNAMSRQLVTELRDFFTALPGDRQTRVVVLRGAGRAFCAGLDLKESQARITAREQASGRGCARSAASPSWCC
jgi:enoyl-CoA hydratase/carnithine racemase